jgi:hypothetical protein
MAMRHALVAIVTLALSAKRGVLATATPLATATDHVLSGADRDTAGVARAPQSQVSPPPFDDWHYPSEELDEEALVRELRLLSADEQEQVRGVSHMTPTTPSTRSHAPLVLRAERRRGLVHQQPTTCDKRVESSHDTVLWRSRDINAARSRFVINRSCGVVVSARPSSLSWRACAVTLTMHLISSPCTHITTGMQSGQPHR